MKENESSRLNLPSLGFFDWSYEFGSVVFLLFKFWTGKGYEYSWINKLKTKLCYFGQQYYVYFTFIIST